MAGFLTLGEWVPNNATAKRSVVIICLDLRVDNMNYLSVLPHALAVSVLSDWLTQMHLGTLDAAFCSKNSRERFHELLSSKELTIQDSVLTCHQDIYIAWHLSRKTKMRSLQLPSSVDAAESKAVAHFLRCVGGPEGVHLKVLNVTFCQHKSCVENGVCNLFHLEELCMIGSADMDVIDALVRNSATSFRKLTFAIIGDAVVTDKVYFAHSNFRNLTSLSVSWCNHFDASLVRMLSTTAKLENVSITGSDRLSDDMYHLLLTRNPRLKSMRFANCPGLTSDVLLSAAPTLRELERVEIEYCRLVDTCAITALATHCPRLCHVGLAANSPTFLVTAVEVLAKHCGGRLETLRVNGYNNVPACCLQALGTSCMVLRTLSLPVHEAGMFTRSPARDVVRFFGTELPALRSLDVGGNYVDDQTLTEISEACGNLNTLGLRVAWGYTAAGAQALVQSAVQLREVQLTRWISKHVPANAKRVAVWEEVALTQPQLKITLDYA